MRAIFVIKMQYLPLKIINIVIKMQENGKNDLFL